MDIIYNYGIIISCNNNNYYMYERIEAFLRMHGRGDMRECPRGGTFTYCTLCTHMHVYVYILYG